MPGRKNNMTKRRKNKWKQKISKKWLSNIKNRGKRSFRSTHLRKNNPNKRIFSNRNIGNF